MSSDSQHVFMLNNMQTTATFPAAYSEGVKSELNDVMVTHLTGKPEHSC
jgi:hypothetical protein